MKKILSIMLVLLMSVTLFACTKAETPKEPETNAPPVSDKAEMKCSVEIECKGILENEKKFKGDSAKIPEGGIFLESTEIEIEDGMTAYDVFTAICDKNNIETDIQDSQYGKYINGIGGISSGDCGGYSGWMYYVNGEPAQVGIGEYKVQNGDEITFTYSCD